MRRGAAVAHFNRKIARSMILVGANRDGAHIHCIVMQDFPDWTRLISPDCAHAE